MTNEELTEYMASLADIGKQRPLQNVRVLPRAIKKAYDEAEKQGLIAYDRLTAKGYGILNREIGYIAQDVITAHSIPPKEQLSLFLVLREHIKNLARPTVLLIDVINFHLAEERARIFVRDWLAQQAVKAPAKE
ncbi:MAG TPA: hypothetical protein VEF04_10220 [Blastocatellia bacterium]|nr:hypothetical protein [Blastocatellia bacterium]